MSELTDCGGFGGFQKKARVQPWFERWKPQKRESQLSQRYGHTNAKRNQMRSTKPRRVERRTAVLVQMGHSRIFLAKVSCMSWDAFRFC